jgi:LysR family hydrogen peroxide-inducible transcriptional activator
MEMQQVRYFLALSEDLNFTRAAQRCQVSQPTLSRAIKLLEHELGAPLFHRERAHTHLSELGRMVRPYFQQVHGGIEGAKHQARAFLLVEKTKLRLGLMCTIAPGNLLGLVGCLQAHPGVELQIVDAPASKLKDALLNGDLEVAIFAMPMTPPDDRLHYLPLYREQFVIVLHPRHRLATSSSIRVRDLCGERYLSRINCEFDQAATRIFEERGGDGPTVYESERDDWILAMAAAGMGYAFMPELSVDQAEVVTRPLVQPEFWREVALVTVRGRPHSPAIGVLVREARNALAELRSGARLRTPARRVRPATTASRRTSKRPPSSR